MVRKVVHISLGEEVYRKFREMAKREHLKLSTWIRKKLMDITNGEEK
jgi:hypothetical protein